MFISRSRRTAPEAKAKGQTCLGLVGAVQGQYDDVTLMHILDDIIVGGAKPVSIYLPFPKALHQNTSILQILLILILVCELEMLEVMDNGIKLYLTEVFCLYKTLSP